LHILSPEDVYEQFHNDLRNKKQSAAKTLLRAFQEETRWYPGRLEYEPFQEEKEERTVWDPRWVQLFVELDEADLVCRLVQEPDSNVIEYLAAKCEKQPQFNRGQTSNMLLVLFGMQEPRAPQLLMDILEKGGNKQYYYLDRVQLTLLSMLPREYADRLRQHAEQLTYPSLKEQILEIAETIAAKPGTNQMQDNQEKGQGLWEWIRSKMS